MIFIITFAIFLPFRAESYNLDTKHALIYTDPTSNTTNNTSDYGSYFGYSVLLAPQSDDLEPQLFVGAPRGNHSHVGKVVKEPGIVYQCASSSKKCNPVSSTLDSPADIAVKQIGMYAKVIQDHGWFGTSIAAIHPNLLKICAPRTKIELFRPFTNEYMETLQGMCYFYSRSSTNSFLQIDTESLATYNFSTSHWYNPQHGFSQNVAVGLAPTAKLDIQEKSESTMKLLLKNVSMILGNPTNEASGSVNVVQRGTRKTLQIANDGHEQSELGYSVTSGRFFGENSTYFASGAPVWKFIGKVAIINCSGTATTADLTFLHGQELGEYFGASLASGDLNGDGFDELVVGAPHHGDDSGKVYIYLGNRDAFTQHDLTIEGTVGAAQYGYSLACGDLDSDGFSDLIVGAPWEEFGAIYVYYGHRSLDEDNTLQASRRISAREISPRLRGFGFSISNFVDFDNNGFADVAVGAYKSSDVALLRTRVVEKIQISELKLQPGAMKRTTQKLTIEFCMKNYKSPNVRVYKNYTIVINVDSKHKRFTYSQLVWDIPVADEAAQIFEYQYLSQPKKSRLTNSRWNGCIASHFNLKPNVRDVINPVEISLTYELNSYENDGEFCKFCPIQYVQQGRGSKRMQELSVPFEAECASANKVCSSDISVTTTVYNVKNNSIWEIGSGDLGIELKLQNHGEPAHLVVTDFLVPRGVHLRSVLPFCQENQANSDFLIVSCSMGDPFDKGVQKTIRLDLDMSHYETHSLSNVEKQQLDINVTVRSQTVNEGVKQISIPIILKSNVSFSISGISALENNQFDNFKENTAGIAFRHEYYAFKHGATPVTNGKIRISVPAKIRGKSFVFLVNAKLQALGIVHECESSDIESTPENDLKSSVPKENTRVHTAAHEELFEKNASTVSIVDCSSRGVGCGSVTCDLGPLKSSSDVGIVTLNFVATFEPFGDLFKDKNIIQLGTRALLEVTSPAKSYADFAVITTFYDIKEPSYGKKLNVWIFFASFVIGLVLVSIMAAVLHKLGFFRKRQVLEINFLSRTANEDPPDQDLMEDVDDEIEENS